MGSIEAMIAMLRGLYAITAETSSVVDVGLAIAGGARLIQYRNKHAGATERQDTARALLALCRAAGVPLVINDDLALALRIGADGVHLGRDDADPREAREQLGPGALIGVSCYDDLARAERAGAAGASYVAFGSFFPSPTKPQAVPAPLGLLREARRRVPLPLVAIGGITPQNGGALVAAGADLLAVIDGVFGQADIRAAAGRYTRLFSMEAIGDESLS